MWYGVRHRADRVPTPTFASFTRLVSDHHVLPACHAALGVGGSLDLCVGTERSAASETSVSILRRDQLDVDVDLIESQYQLNYHIYFLEQ